MPAPMDCSAVKDKDKEKKHEIPRWPHDHGQALRWKVFALPSLKGAMMRVRQGWTYCTILWVSKYRPPAKTVHKVNVEGRYPGSN